MKNKSILFTPSAAIHDLLAKLMNEDLATNRTAFLSRLIAEEAARRRKPATTRPRKAKRVTSDDYSTDLPKTIPYFGEMIGPREYADRESTREMFAPKN